MSNGQKQFNITPYIVMSVVVFYAVLCILCDGGTKGMNFFEMLLDGGITGKTFNPVVMFNNLTAGSVLIALAVAFLFGLCVVGLAISGNKLHGDMEGIEQGSAKWLVDCESSNKKESAEARDYRRTMMDADLMKNIMYNNVYGISLDGKKTRRNLHMLVVGGSGAGKTRFFVKPNILQMNCSYIVTDPSGELYRDEAEMLREAGYDVRVFNTFNPDYSMQYNPLAYIRTEENVMGTDVLSLVTTLVKNTGEASGENKYFDDATKQLLQAIIAYICKYEPPEKRNFSRVIELVIEANAAEGEKSKLDQRFAKLAQSEGAKDGTPYDPYGLPKRLYDSFTAKGKTLQSVLSSTTVRLTVFRLKEVELLTCADTVSLDTIGDEKTALFIITPPTDNGLNFLVAMMYSQLFSRLYYHDMYEAKYLLTDGNMIARPFVDEEDAKHVLDLITKQKNAGLNQKFLEYRYNDMTNKYDMYDYEKQKIVLRDIRECTKKTFEQTPEIYKVKRNGKEGMGSPIHVRMLMDEFANINEIPDFVGVLSTVRKYNMSIVIILQSLSQLKKRYEKDCETIIDNCDTFVFLGSKGADTTEYVSKMLGNKTIRQAGESESRGKSSSSSNSISKQKRELMTPNELAMLSSDEQIVILKGVSPFRIKKYTLEKHPNFKLSADGDGAPADISKHSLIAMERVSQNKRRNLNYSGEDEFDNFDD